VSTEENKAVIRRLVEEVYNAGTPDAVDELVAPDVFNHPAVAEHRHGIDSFIHVIMLVTVALVMAAMMAISALPALAFHPHRHLLTPTNGEEIAVGPQVCENPQTHTGFSQFHSNVHFGTPNQEVFGGDHPVDFRASGC
jgi:hypothetical protein